MSNSSLAKTDILICSVETHPRELLISKLKKRKPDSIGIVFFGILIVCE